MSTRSGIWRAKRALPASRPIMTDHVTFQVRNTDGRVPLRAKRVASFAAVRRHGVGAVERVDHRHSGSVAQVRCHQPAEPRRSGMRPPLTQQVFTTENAEEHGAPRRFFEFPRHSPTLTEWSIARMQKRLLDIIAAPPQRHRSIARPAQGPLSPCTSVVLRVLRGKTLRHRSKTPATTKTRFHKRPHSSLPPQQA